MENIIFSIITYLPRKKFRKAIDKKIKSIEETLMTLRKERNRCQSNGGKSLEEIHNTGIYMVLFNLDLTVLMKQLVLERNQTVRRVYAKQVITLLYEFFDDFPEVFGKKIKIIISNLPSDNQHDEQFRTIGIALRNFRKTHQKEFKKIRDAIGAHRDLDGELQITTLEAINEEEITTLTGEIDEWFNHITRLLTEMILDYSNSRLMLKEIVVKIDQDEMSNG